MRLSPLYDLHVLPRFIAGHVLPHSCCWLHIFPRLLPATATHLWLVSDMLLRQMSAVTCSPALCFLALSIACFFWFTYLSVTSLFAAVVAFYNLSFTTNTGKPLLIYIFRQQNPDIVMLNFRNLSYENDAGNEHHLQNGVTQNGVTQNGAINNIGNHNSFHKRDVQMSNGTIGEHNPRDQTFLSRDYPHVQEPPFNRPNRCRWRCKITANAIDAWSRVLFPLAYGLFIVAYWIIYSSANTDKKSQWMTGSGNICSILISMQVHTRKHREWTNELSDFKFQRQVVILWRPRFFERTVNIEDSLTTK